MRPKVTWNGSNPCVPTLISRKLKPQIRDSTPKRTRQSRVERWWPRVEAEMEGAAEVDVCVGEGSGGGAGVVGSGVVRRLMQDTIPESIS